MMFLDASSPAHVLIFVGFALAYLAAIWAILVTIADSRYQNPEKVIWALELALFPVLGLVVWLCYRALRLPRRA
jgi:hypothetical protein